MSTGCNLIMAFCYIVQIHIWYLWQWSHATCIFNNIGSLAFREESPRFWSNYKLWPRLFIRDQSYMSGLPCEVQLSYYPCESHWININASWIYLEIFIWNYHLPTCQLADPRQPWKVHRILRKCLGHQVNRGQLSLTRLRFLISVKYSSYKVQHD